MRPVDAEALLLKAIEEKRFIFSYTDALSQELVMETVYHDLAEFILSAPVLDVEPVRHGRLKHRHVNSHHIPSSCKVICTECGYEKSRLDGEIIRYCQYCGAKMDLEGE